MISETVCDVKVSLIKRGYIYKESSDCTKSSAPYFQFSLPKISYTSKYLFIASKLSYNTSRFSLRIVLNVYSCNQ